MAILHLLHLLIWLLTKHAGTALTVSLYCYWIKEEREEPRPREYCISSTRMRSLYSKDFYLRYSWYSSMGSSWEGGKEVWVVTGLMPDLWPLDGQHFHKIHRFRILRNVCISGVSGLRGRHEWMGPASSWMGEILHEWLQETLNPAFQGLSQWFTVKWESFWISPPKRSHVHRSLHSFQEVCNTQSS